MLLFILSWAIKQLIFTYWLYLLIKHCFWGTFLLQILDILQYLPHIFTSYFSLAWSPVISLRLDFQRYRAENVFGSLISGDTAENVFGSLISTRLDRRSYQPTTCLNPRNFFLPRCLKCSLPFKPIVSLIFC